MDIATFLGLIVGMPLVTATFYLCIYRGIYCDIQDGKKQGRVK